MITRITEEVTEFSTDTLEEIKLASNPFRSPAQQERLEQIWREHRLAKLYEELPTETKINYHDL